MNKIDLIVSDAAEQIIAQSGTPTYLENRQLRAILYGVFYKGVSYEIVNIKARQDVDLDKMADYYDHYMDNFTSEDH